MINSGATLRHDDFQASEVEDLSMSPKKPAKSATAAKKKSKGLTDEELGAMKDRIKELKSEDRRASSADKSDGESEVLAKIAAMVEPDRTTGKRLHALIKAIAPELSPRTW